MMFHTILEFEMMDSTNDFLKENHSYFPHMTFIKTNFQNKGRGQFDRTWESEKGVNLLFSILIKELPIDQIDTLKNIVINSLKSFFKTHGIYPTFKEPNDLYVENNKICGILIETRTEINQLDYAIIGIGINVNQNEFITPFATSMKNETHHLFDLQQLFQEFVNLFTKTYALDIGGKQ